MHADDVLLLLNSRKELQAGLDYFYDYCLKWNFSREHYKNINNNI